MVQVFSWSEVVIHSDWVRLSQVEPSLVRQWNCLFQSSGLITDKETLLIRATYQEYQEVGEHQPMIRSVRELVGDHWINPLKVHVFVLADEKGTVLDIVADKEIVRLLNNKNFKIGSSLTMEHAGINAFSVCMALNRPVIVEGNEHHLTFFSDWTCLCIPIRKAGRIVGYMDMSFESGTEITFATLLLEQVVRRVEEDINRQKSEVNLTKVYEMFANHGLTEREKEVGYRWLVNKTIADIAGELFISEGTVRNFIKKVYAKTGVSGRGEFIHKFLVK